MLVRINRILFPTDFSEPAEQAQRYALSLADRFGAELHLLHVVAPLPAVMPDSAGAWTLPDADVDLHVDAARKRLARTLGDECGAEQRAVLSVKVGLVVDEVVRYAHEHEIDLIVVGTHGHTGLSRLLLGSVAEKLVRLAECPVLTVHPKGHQFVSEIATDGAASVVP